MPERVREHASVMRRCFLLACVESHSSPNPRPRALLLSSPTPHPERCRPLLLFISALPCPLFRSQVPRALFTKFYLQTRNMFQVFFGLISLCRSSTCLSPPLCLGSRMCPQCCLHSVRPFLFSNLSACRSPPSTLYVFPREQHSALVGPLRHHITRTSVCPSVRQTHRLID